MSPVYVDSVPPLEGMGMATELLAGFHALSDPLRLGILTLLRDRELCVCDLCDALSVAQSKLSFHLKILRLAGLVTSRQAGRWMYYSLNRPVLVRLEQYLAQMGQASLSAGRPPCP